MVALAFTFETYLVLSQPYQGFSMLWEGSLDQSRRSSAAVAFPIST
jgi:hypothetical protein